MMSHLLLLFSITGQRASPVRGPGPKAGPDLDPGPVRRAGPGPAPGPGRGPARALARDRETRGQTRPSPGSRCPPAKTRRRLDACKYALVLRVFFLNSCFFFSSFDKVFNTRYGLMRGGI